MNNTVQIFENEAFGTIRTMVDEKGETYFVGKDVALALGYNNTRKALQDRVDKEDRTDGVTIRDSIGRIQRVVVINESGLYSLIMSSQLPSAKAFKRWVTKEVLPQIRRTGGYIPTKDSRTGEKLTAAQIMKTADAIMQRTIAEENAPADGCLSSTEVAKLHGLELKDFFLLLDAAGIIHWKGGRNCLTSAYAHLGLAEDRVFHYYTLNGQKRYRPYLAWTAAGVEFIKGLLGGKGYASHRNLSKIG